MPRVRRGRIVEDRIARRYKKAGFIVERRKITAAGEIDILAKRNKKRYAIEVKHSNKGRIITSSEVRKLHKKARSVRANPVLILSGNAKLSKIGKKEANKTGTRVRIC
ncbi:MAG: restriction endonuclease [Archaeoglobaceae archaeon]